MNTPRHFDWDPAKHNRNVAERGIPFDLVREFDFDTAMVAVDDRKAYAEVRQVAAGFIGERLYMLVFTMRGDTCRVISLRKCNKREIKAYVRQVTELE